MAIAQVAKEQAARQSASLPTCSAATASASKRRSDAATTDGRRFLADASTLPPGTAVTATLRVERLTDDEIVEMKRLLYKLGVEALPSGPAQE